MKKTLVVGAVAMAGLGLVGCATGGSPDSDERAGNKGSSLYERSVGLTDGREVTCVVNMNGYQGGLSCDWANAE